MATASATISPARTASEISVKTPSRGSRSTFSNSSPGVHRASVGRSASSRPTMAPTSRLPLHSTAVGLVLLAFAPAGLQEEFLTRPMPREPDRVLIPPEVMRRTLAEVRRARLAVHPPQRQEGNLPPAAPPL